MSYKDHGTRARKLSSKNVKLRKVLLEVGNIIGGPTMGYASAEIQVEEYERMVEKAHALIINTLRTKETPLMPSQDKHECQEYLNDAPDGKGMICTHPSHKQSFLGISQDTALQLLAACKWYDNYRKGLSKNISEDDILCVVQAAISQAEQELGGER